jgi:hypothetical protein
VGGADEEELEGGTGGEELGGDNIGMSLGQHRTEKIMSERPVGVVFCFGFVVGVEWVCNIYTLEVCKWSIRSLVLGSDVENNLRHQQNRWEARGLAMKVSFFL